MKSAQTDSPSDARSGQNLDVRAGPVVLRAVEASKTYPAEAGRPPLQALRSATLEVREGESVAIVGRSGSGKSTLLSLLAGLDRPTSGRVEAMGRDWASVPPRELNAFRASRMGVVFQQFYLIDHLTAFENARLPLDLAGRRDSDDVARSWLERVGLAARADHFPSQMSRGEQQRCAIARALVAGPRVVLADEPTGSLDSRTAREVMDVVFGLAKQERHALVIVTHDPSVAERCDRALAIVDGVLGPVPSGQARPST